MNHDTLYRKHNADLLRYASNVTGASDEALDIVHQAWAEFIASGSEPENPQAWLKLIIKRGWWRFARRQKGVIYTGQHDRLDSPCEGDQEPHCERNRIGDAIDCLRVPLNGRSDKMQPASDAMKANLGLMFAGYDSAEIAQIRGVSGAGVRDNLTRGIKALKAHWGIDDNE